MSWYIIKGVDVPHDDRTVYNVDGSEPTEAADGVEVSRLLCCDICGSIFDDEAWKRYTVGRKKKLTVCRLCRDRRRIEDSDEMEG